MGNISYQRADRDDAAYEAWQYRTGQLSDWVMETSMDAVRDALPTDLADRLSALMNEVYDRLESAAIGGDEGKEIKAILERI